MLWYPIIHSLAVSFIQWCMKSFSHSTDMTQPSYIKRPMYMTSLILKLKLRKKSHLRLWIEILRQCKRCNKFFICHKWSRKIISCSTDMMETCYIQRPMYMTPLILKLKPGEKYDFRFVAVCSLVNEAVKSFHEVMIWNKLPISNVLRTIITAKSSHLIQCSTWPLWSQEVQCTYMYVTELSMYLWEHELV